MKRVVFYLCISMGMVGVLHAGDALSTQAALLKAKHIKEQMQKEKKFAKEQKFYQAQEYDFSEEEVDPADLDSIPMIEPENDFDMTDVYRDDI